MTHFLASMPRTSPRRRLPHLAPRLMFVCLMTHFLACPQLPQEATASFCAEADTWSNLQDEPEAVSTPPAAAASAQVGRGTSQSTAAESGQHASASTVRPARSRLARQTNAAGNVIDNGSLNSKDLPCGHQKSKGAHRAVLMHLANHA